MIKRRFVFAFAISDFFVKSETMAKIPKYRTVAAVKTNSTQSTAAVLDLDGLGGTGMDGQSRDDKGQRHDHIGQDPFHIESQLSSIWGTACAAICLRNSGKER